MFFNLTHGEHIVCCVNAALAVSSFQQNTRFCVFIFSWKSIICLQLQKSNPCVTKNLIINDNHGNLKSQKRVKTNKLGLINGIAQISARTSRVVYLGNIQCLINQKTLEMSDVKFMNIPVIIYHFDTLLFLFLIENAQNNKNLQIMNLLYFALNWLVFTFMWNLFSHVILGN